MTDWELLRQYREQNSNDAFRKLADRHMRLVYSTCRRDLVNTQAAEDATQLVFILLARKASAMAKGVSISSWLFGTARFVCKDMIKSEMRRRRREEAALGMEQARTGNEEWDQIEPRLNDALSALNTSDREAVLMRYYDGMSLREIAGEIGATEDTARKRVARAVDRLRRYFQRESATASLLSLDTLLLTYAAHSVPDQAQAVLMSTLQNLGAAHGAASGLYAHSGVLLKKGAIVLMDATLKKVLVGLALVAVVGAFVGIPHFVSHLRYEQLVAQDTSTVIDAAPAVSPDQTADRNAILARIREGMEDYRRRDISRWKDEMVPGVVINLPGRPAMSVAEFVQQEDQVFNEVGPFHVTTTVESLQIQGNAAQLALSVHFEGPTVKYQQVPAGLKIASDETEKQQWLKVNGRWVTAKVDVISFRTAVDGRVVYQLPGPGQPPAQ